MKIDYDKIKLMLPVKKVLNVYGLDKELTETKYKLYGKCPIHRGDNPSAFHVDLDKNLWNCFTRCGGGSVIDLLMNIENIDVYQAGLIGEKLLGTDSDYKVFDSNKLPKPKPQLINKPLEFRLNLFSEHPYLSKRNISQATAKFFEIGYCNKGIMKDRIAIPIHNENNNLLAYCGRTIDETLPKYQFPIGFKKNEVLYNFNRIIQNQNNKLFVVEGFFDVFRLYQAGIESVAVMGSSLSPKQKNLLEQTNRKLLFMFDGDKAGRKGMAKAENMFNPKIETEIIYLPEKVQPENLSDLDIQKLNLILAKNDK